MRPPDDTDVWLDGPTVALMLGISTTRVSQLARRDRLPNTRRGRRRWFRRSRHRASRSRSSAPSGWTYLISIERVELPRGLPVRPPLDVALPQPSSRWVHTRSSPVTPHGRSCGRVAAMAVQFVTVVRYTWKGPRRVWPGAFLSADQVGALLTYFNWKFALMGDPSSVVMMTE